MTDINEFLSQRTQLCERQHARIIPAQCQTCRDRHDAFCIGCAGLVPTYPLSAVQEEKNMASRHAECRLCKRTLQIRRDGTCSRCIERIEKGLDPVTGEPAKAAVTVPEPVEAVDPVDPVEAEVSTDEEWESAGWEKKEVHYAEPEFEPDTELDTEHLLGTQNIPENIPPMDNLLRLIDPDGWLVEIPRDLSQSLHDEGITPYHIVELCEMLLNGELRRVA